MMEAEKKRRAIERCLMVMVLGCIAAYLGMFLLLNTVGFERYCDSDMYADTLVAKKMWEQKAFFPEGWIYSNQYFVVATPALTALFYGLTGNVSTAMGMATELMTVFILISLVWLLRAFTKDPLTILFAILLFIASVIAPDGPRTLNTQLFFVGASFYACYLITMFVVFGDYVRAFQSKKLRIGTLILCLILSFATGMQSLRQTLVMVLPILACEVFLALRRMIQRKKPWDRETVGTLLRALGYGAANLAGLITTELLHLPHTAIYGDMELTPLWAIPQKLPPIWTAFQEISSLNYALDRNYSPWFAVFCFFLLAVAAAAAVLWLSRIHKMEDALELCWLLCLIGMFGCFLSCVVFLMNLRSVYIFMWYPLVVFSGLMLLRKCSFWPKCMAIVLTCILSLGCLWHGYVPYAGIALWKGPTDGQLMCDWAMSEGYEYVYGHWFVAPRVAACSGGEMEAGYWWEPMEPMTYNIASDIFDEEDNEKAIYVFTPDDEEDCLRIAAEKGVELTKVAEFGDYKAYTSPVPLLEAPVPGNN